MNSLVTGGCGFIGSHMVDKLLGEKHHVTVIDNMSTGRAKNLEHLKDNPDLKVVEADINDFGKINSLFEGVDNVFHLAALADIVPSIDTPVAYHRSNEDARLSFIDACRKHNVSR